MFFPLTCYPNSTCPLTWTLFHLGWFYLKRSLSDLLLLDFYPYYVLVYTTHIVFSIAKAYGTDSIVAISAYHNYLLLRTCGTLDTTFTSGTCWYLMENRCPWKIYKEMSWTAKLGKKQIVHDSSRLQVLVKFRRAHQSREETGKGYYKLLPFISSVAQFFIVCLSCATTSVFSS